jgi:hypothetical protein
MIPLFIPYVNRPDLLDKAIRSAWHSGVEIITINNSGESIACPSAAIQDEPPVPLTFAQTQNLMLRRALGNDYSRGYNVWIKHSFYLFMHNDAQAGEGTVKKLVELAEQYTGEGRRWGVLWTAYDALAAFNTAALQAVGGWDQNLPWYFSDNDVYLRLKLAGYECIDTHLPVEHTPSQTMNSDPEIMFMNGILFPMWEHYYIRKWGGKPGKECFLTPFNR